MNNMVILRIIDFDGYFNNLKLKMHSGCAYKIKQYGSIHIGFR